MLRTEPATNTVVVGTREQLLRRRARLRDVGWLAPEPARAAAEGWSLQVRAHHAPVAVTGITAAPGSDGELLDVDLAPPGEALPPGQTGVLYAGERALGAGLLAPA